MEVKNLNSEQKMKSVSEKQINLINQLLQSHRLERSVCKSIDKILKRELTSYEASKVICYILALIKFKTLFFRNYNRKSNSVKSVSSAVKEAYAEELNNDYLEQQQAEAERSELILASAYDRKTLNMIKDVSFINGNANFTANKIKETDCINIEK